MAMKIKKGDQVIVITGRDKGKTGEVIKSMPKENKVVVQGGTLYNDAVLRSLETIAGVEVTRPDIAGIMGAFGAALIARERHEADYKTSMLSIEQIKELTYTTKLTRCKGCTNHCMLTINKFSDNHRSQHKVYNHFIDALTFV